MRTLLLVLTAAVGLVGSVVAKAADAIPAAVLASEAVDPGQSAVWERRKLQRFTQPLTINSETQGWREASCDQIYATAKNLLLQLGARASDMVVDERPCYSFSRIKSIDVSFSVLAPADRAKPDSPGPAVEAHWKTVTMGGNCAYLEHVTKTVLPLFTARNVKIISIADCAKIGVGLRAQVLKGPAESVDSP